MEGKEYKTKKSEFLAKIIFEIEQLLPTSVNGLCDKYKSDIYWVSSSPYYPSYLIEVFIGDVPQWIMFEDNEEYIVVSVTFFERMDVFKNRSSLIEKGESPANNKNLHKEMGKLIDEVFDESGSYDISLYPSEEVARKTLQRIFGNVGDGDNPENDDEFDDAFLLKDEISELVDDLFENGKGISE